MNKKLDLKIKEKANPSKAKDLQRFFKTGKGHYGEGDVFLGIIVPEQRKIAVEFKDISLEEIENLLNSEIHEKRLIALLILIEQLKKAGKEKDEKLKEEIFKLYLKKAHENKVNNWDLVDLSAPRIVGNYLLDKKRDILYELTKGNLWEKRISVISTFAFIKNSEFNDSLKIAEILLNDKHDLMHKAVGWMLREIGKKDIRVLEEFLKKHYKNMPRTMLRYAIEKFDEKKRKMYLKREI
ncbi:DNA alkylation repair protein [Candidatus Pacearchaeota archaeon]|nr:DNA alkylation repair protein [Candidatus Pacearchaeota archaeon]